MIDENITVEVDAKLADKNWTLEIMDSVFYEQLDYDNDYEYAIAVLLDYATAGGVEGDIGDALEEIVDGVENH